MSDLQLATRSTETSTLQVLRRNLLSLISQPGLIHFHGEYWEQLKAIDAELEVRSRQKFAKFAECLTRAAGVLICAVALAAMSGCAGTFVTAEVSVGANVTKSLTGAGYDGGIAGPKDVVQFAVQVQRGRGFCELRHISHLSAGPPFNDSFEDFGDFLSCGIRLRSGGF